jgi:hypothetical protein
MSDGTERAVVRPVLQAKPTVLPLESYQMVLARHRLIPRVEELLKNPRQIPIVLSRYPSAPPVADHLPEVLDTADPWVRAAAYVAWGAECEGLYFQSADAFVHSGGDADAKAQAASRFSRHHRSSSRPRSSRSTIPSRTTEAASSGFGSSEVFPSRTVSRFESLHSVPDSYEENLFRELDAPVELEVHGLGGKSRRDFRRIRETGKLRPSDPGRAEP